MMVSVANPREKQRIMRYLYLIFFSFALSPFTGTIEGYFFWQFVSPLLVLTVFDIFLPRFLFSGFLGFGIYFFCIVILGFVFRGTKMILEAGLFLTSLVPTIILLSLDYETYRDEINGFVRFVFWFTSFVAWYQLVARIVHPDWSFSAHQRFRVLFGFLDQTTSTFFEPRFYGQFLTMFLFVFLRFEIGGNRHLIFILTLLQILLTFSMGAYITTVIILVINFCRILYKFGHVIFFGLVAFILLVISGIGQSIATYVLDRFSYLIANINNASLEPGLLLRESYRFNFVGMDWHPALMRFGGSAYQSLIVETSVLLHVATVNPIFGLWFTGITRTVSLNAMVEFFFRFGLPGFILFVYGIHSTGVRFRGIALLIFLVFWTAIDGAIAKPGFWLWFGILVVYLKGGYEEDIQAASQ